MKINFLQQVSIFIFFSLFIQTILTGSSEEQVETIMQINKFN